LEWCPLFSGVPAGKLIKIDAEILDLCNRLRKTKDKNIQKKIDALTKQREIQIKEIQRRLRSGD